MKWTDLFWDTSQRRLTKEEIAGSFDNAIKEAKKR